MFNRLVFLATVLVAVAVAGCQVPPYTPVYAGPAQVGDLQVSPESTWNRIAPKYTPLARETAQVWTHDGELLNRLMLIPAVGDGEPIFSAPNDAVALPVFRADMLPNEIEELVQSSMTKLLGEGESTVHTENLRPAKFGEQRGVMFDFTSRLTEGPDYRGLVGAFVASEQLYVIIYLGADPHYFAKHRAEAEAIILSARA